MTTPKNIEWLNSTIQKLITEADAGTLTSWSIVWNTESQHSTTQWADPEYAIEMADE